MRGIECHVLAEHQVYIGTTKCSINTCLGEHKQYCHLAQTQKSAIVEHELPNEYYTNLFVENQVLSLPWWYFAWLQREADEIQKHSDHSINEKKESLVLNKYAIPALESIGRTW